MKIEDATRTLSTQQRKFLKKMKDGVWYDSTIVFRGIRSRKALIEKGIVEPKEYNGKVYDFMIRLTRFGTEIRDALLEGEYVRGRKVGDELV